MKRFIIHAAVLILSLALPIYGASAAIPPDMLNMDPFDILNSMQPGELEKILDDLSKMSPEQIKYYEDLGKEMFEKSGYDLDALQKGTAQPPVKAPVTTVVQPQPTKTPSVSTDQETLSSKKEKDALLQMINKLLDSLSSIRQKAATDQTLQTHVSSLHYDLDLLTAYISRLDFERHLKHFADKEFTPLKTKLRKMSVMLDELDNKLSVPEVIFTNNVAQVHSNKQRTMLAQANNVLSQFKNYMHEAFTKDTIITDLENLFKKYDKEALEIKKKIEDQQKKAGEQARKLPTTNTGIFAPIPKYGQPKAGQPGQMQQGNRPTPSYGSGTAQQTNRAYPQVSGATPARSGAAAQQPANSATRNPQDKKPGEASAVGKDKEKDKETTQIPLTFDERTQEIKQDLKKLNAQVGQNKGEILRVATALRKTSPATPPTVPPTMVPTPEAPRKEDVEALFKIMPPFKATKKKFDKFFTDLESKDATKITAYKKQFRDFFNATELAELFQVQTEFEPAAGVALTGAIGGNDEAKDGLELIKNYVSFFNAIKKLVTSMRSV